MEEFIEMLDCLQEERKTYELLASSREQQRVLHDRLTEQQCKAGAPFVYRAALASRQAELKRQINNISRGIDAQLANACYVSSRAERREEHTRFNIVDADLNGLKERALIAEKENRRLCDQKYSLEMQLFQLEQKWRKIRTSARVTSRERILKQLAAQCKAYSGDIEQDSGSQ